MGLNNRDISKDDQRARSKKFWKDLCDGEKWWHDTMKRTSEAHFKYLEEKKKRENDIE